MVPVIAGLPCPCRPSARRSLGAVPGGLPHISLPYVSWSQLRRLPGLVLTVTFVCIAQTAATVRASGATAPTDFNRDLIGVGAGIVLSLAAARGAGTLLFGLQPNDPLSLVAASVFLVAVALIASYVPARRASRIDPTVALRCE